MDEQYPYNEKYRNQYQTNITNGMFMNYTNIMFERLDYTINPAKTRIY